MSETLTKLDNLSKKCSSAASGSRTKEVLRTQNQYQLLNTQKCGNLTIHFRQGSVGTHIRRGGQYIPYIVGNLLRCHCAKNYRNRLTFDCYCKNKKGAIFLRHSV